MFVTYLLRELRRRMRQAIFIALGLALGVGLVITVTAASKGVSASQGTVLKSLYGVGTDISVTQSPTSGSGSGSSFNFRNLRTGSTGSVSLNRDILVGGGLGTLKTSDVTTIAGQKDVSAADGALVLNDVKLSGTVGAGSSSPGSLSTSSFTVTGVDPSSDSLGPLASRTIISGHSITTAEANSDVAVIDSDYATSDNLKVGSTMTVAGKGFTVTADGHRD
jgi:putative ABC transport system permease protein